MYADRYEDNWCGGHCQRTEAGGYNVDWLLSAHSSAKQPGGTKMSQQDFS